MWGCNARTVNVVLLLQKEEGREEEGSGEGRRGFEEEEILIGVMRGKTLFTSCKFISRFDNLTTIYLAFLAIRSNPPSRTTS